MKKIKKWLTLFTSLCVGACISAFVACDGEESFSQTSSGSSTQQSSVEEAEETLTITVKDTKNNPMSGIKITISKGATAVAQVTTTANGTASAQLQAGMYTLTLDYETLPTMFIPDASQKTVTIADEEAFVEFTLEDLNPDGSQDKPFTCFPGETEQFALTLPANTTYYYNAVKVVSKKIIIHNESVTVTFNNDVYTPVAGELEIPIGANATSPNTLVPFSVCNTTGAELSVVIYFEDIITIEQRDLTFNEEIKVSLPDSGTTIDYNWTATSDGTLRIECNADRRNIAINVKDDMANVTTMMEGNELIVEVKAGASVKVIVSATMPAQGDAPAEIPFTATFTPATQS